MILHPNSVVPNDMIPKCFISVWVIASLMAIFLAFDWLRSKDVDERMENGYAALGSAAIGIVALFLGDWLS